MSETTIPTFAREVGERERKKLYRLAGAILEDDELRTLVAQYREVELDHWLDRELDLNEPEVGREVLAAAYKRLRSLGVDPDSASQEELLGALRAVS